MSLDQHEIGARTAPLDEAALSALGSVRAEGLEPDAFGMAMLGAVCAGELTTDDAVARVVAHYTA